MRHIIIILFAVAISLLYGCDNLYPHNISIADGKSYRSMGFPSSLEYGRHDFLLTPTGGVVTIYLKKKGKLK